LLQLVLRLKIGEIVPPVFQ